MSGSISDVIGSEDLAFLVASYVCPDRAPSRPFDLCDALCRVSRSWRAAFGLVRAQLRWDDLRALDDEGGDWMYHRLCCVPGAAADETGRTLPPEGCLQVFRSHCAHACRDAADIYKNDLRNDQYRGSERVDSRPDYYYRAHRETPERSDFVLPRPLPYKSTIACANEIEYDKRPRLVNKMFTTLLGDCIGLRSHVAGTGRSAEGHWDLGYHEIVSVRALAYSNACHPRPPRDEPGRDTTAFLGACRATASDHPRWIKFCHLAGEDRCRQFLRRHVRPLMGPRPTAADEDGPTSTAAART